MSTKPSNDSSLIGVLKFIGLIDSSQVPTSRWSQYRGASHKKVLGDAIQAGYTELFAVYPDAQSRPRTDLESVFSTSSKGGKEVISKLVSTFKLLADEAEFSAVEDRTEFNIPTGPLHEAVMPNKLVKGGSQSGSGPSLHVDIQIHISPDAGADQIEQIFASMAKHFYGTPKAD